MNRIASCLGAAMLVWAGASAAHDVASSADDGLPLPASLIERTDRYEPLDVSADGRYVLFANYPPADAPDIGEILILDQGNCIIYRKDRFSGALDRVFTSSAAEQRYFCDGAMMSADGQTIIAPVASLPSNPDGELVEIDGEMVVSFGDITALVVADMRSGTVTDLTTPYLTRNANDIARTNLGSINLPTLPYRLETLSGDGSRAIVSRFSFTGRPLTEEIGYVDIATGQIEFEFLPAGEFATALGFLTGLSLSADGQTLLLPLPYRGSGALGGPLVQNVWLYDFATDSATEVVDIRDTVAGSGAAMRTFNRGSLSADGNRISWVRGPAVCQITSRIPSDPLDPFDPFDFSGPSIIVSTATEFCGPTPLTPCEGEECELLFSRFDLLTGELRNTISLIDPDGSTPGFTGQVQFSADGSRILYPRLVREPFGEGFRTRLFDREPTDNAAFVCINRDAVDSGGGIAFEPCEPTLPGPIRPDDGGPIVSLRDYTDYDSPVLWVIKDLSRDREILVSAHAGTLFQSSTAVLSDSGITVAFASRDDRLRDQALFAEDGFDEAAAAIDPACFWPSAGHPLNLRVATNDNVRFFTAPTQYVYEAAPVFCPVPTPANGGHVFVTDVPNGGWPWLSSGRTVHYDIVPRGRHAFGLRNRVTRNLRLSYLTQLRALIHAALMGERTTVVKGAAANARQR